MDKLKLTVKAEDDGQRIDNCLSLYLEDYSRSKIQKLIEKGNITLNGETVKPSKTVAENDEINVVVPEPINSAIIAEDVDFDIVYEDEDLAVINKPQGLIVHPTSSVFTGTLVNGLLKRLDNLSGINGVLRPGIVHRIDKDTSGLLVVAKNDVAHNILAKQIAEKTCKRKYIALCEGIFKEDEGKVETKIGRSPKDRKMMAVTKTGKDALTFYHVVERFQKDNVTLVKFELSTGRTHQIRVHSKYIGHPIVGDPVYGFNKQRFNTNGQLLHAYELTLVHPRTNETMTFSAPLPNYFEKILEQLKKNS